MSKGESEGIPIVQRSYDLCVSLYRHVNRFPWAQRGLLGRVILDDALQMLTVLTVATRRTARTETLEEASGRLDALRIGLRLGKRLGFLSNGGYEELSGVTDEVGRMLGGWLKHETTGDARDRGGWPGARGAPYAGTSLPTPKSIAEQKPRVGGVRYTMTSPTIERYLRLKLQHPQAIVFVTLGAFCQTFFEDAVACGQALRVAVRDVAAGSESEKILTCGIPKAKLDHYIVLLRRGGREVHVE